MEENNMNIWKYDLALCSLGTLGVIIDEEMHEVEYDDGNKGMTYIGYHLTDKTRPVGSPWSSRTPKIIGHIDCDIRLLFDIL